MLNVEVVISTEFIALKYSISFENNLSDCIWSDFNFQKLSKFQKLFICFLSGFTNSDSLNFNRQVAQFQLVKFIQSSSWWWNIQSGTPGLTGIIQTSVLSDNVLAVTWSKKKKFGKPEKKQQLKIQGGEFKPHNLLFFCFYSNIFQYHKFSATQTYLVTTQSWLHFIIRRLVA